MHNELQTQLTATADVSRHAELARQAANMLQAPLREIVAGIRPDHLREVMMHIFTELARVLEYLRLIEVDMQSQDAAPAKNILLFNLVHEGSLALLDYIDTHALLAASENARLFEALDGTTYAINHELRRVFEEELAGINEFEREQLIRAKFKHAHGLLSNCFQQTTVALAHVFNPKLDNALFYTDIQTRLKESLVLCTDLSLLIRYVRHAERERTPGALELLIVRLKFFRDGRMRYLMYKDWEAYEHFVEEVIRVHNTHEVTSVLSGLSCYLETLYGHIRMRAVLSNYPGPLPEI